MTLQKKPKKYKLATRTPQKNRGWNVIFVYFFIERIFADTLNTLFKTCTGVYCHYKDIVHTYNSECGDLI